MDVLKVVFLGITTGKRGGGGTGEGVIGRTPIVVGTPASGDSGEGKDDSVGAELHTGRRWTAIADEPTLPAIEGEGDTEGDDLLLLMGKLMVLPLLRLLALLRSGSATVTTLKREFEGKKSVGELPVEDGDGDPDGLPPPVPPPDATSVTRDTWNRLRDGLGTGDAMGEGMGLGNGDRKRPPPVVVPGGVFLHPLGSSRCCLSAPEMALGDVLIDGQVREIFRELR